MRESHLRSLVKAISWRLLGTIMTIVISFLITGKVSFAIYIGVIEFAAKIVFFYLHERLWAIIPIGAAKNNHIAEFGSRAAQ